MQLFAGVLLGYALNSCLSSSVHVNPVGKVVQLLTDLEQKITSDGVAEDKAYEEYAAFCKTSKSDKEYEIKTAKAEIDDLSATINKALSDTSSAATKIEDLAQVISGNDADLKAATGIREKERAEFVVAEEELVDTVNTLDRAINILQKKLKGSALMQARVSTKDIKNLIKTLSTLIDATALSLHDKKKLMSLAQSSADADEDEDDENGGAPAPEAYKSHSSNIIDVLEDLREKAETQLSEARKEESSAKHNYEMLKQSLEDQIAADQKELAESKATKYNAAEVKATAEGDLGVTKKDLADGESALAELNGGCTTAASDHEASVKSRAEELKALAEAKKVISGMTSGAEKEVYSASFLSSSAATVEVKSNSPIKQTWQTSKW
jgi:chromosome segregation ATPase